MQVPDGQQMAGLNWPAEYRSRAILCQADEPMLPSGCCTRVDVCRRERTRSMCNLVVYTMLA